MRSARARASAFEGVGPDHGAEGMTGEVRAVGVGPVLLSAEAPERDTVDADADSGGD